MSDADIDSDFEDHDPLEGEPPPATAEPVVVPRWVQLVMLPISVLALWVVARAAGPVLLIFIAAAIVALILNPLVTFFQRGLHYRGLAVAAVYFGFFGFLGLAGYLAANPIADQAQSFQRDVPGIIDSANQNLADLQKWLDKQGINLKVKTQGETALQTLQDKVVGGTSDIVSFGGDLVKTIVTAGFALILVFILSIYMLLYGERIGEVVRSVMPPGNGTPEDDYPTRVQRAVAGYVRGQLLFSVAMGAGAALGLYIFGVLGIFPEGKTYAFAFGAFFGLMELIPFVGPFLGALPPVLVALFQDPLTALWVALLFLALQQLEGHVVAPNVFGHTLRINPLLVIFALLVGAEVAGLVGALLALPIAAVVRETVVYLRRHLVLEPWGSTEPAASIASRAPSLPGGRVSDTEEEREEVPSRS
ncbi:MAG: AI-2E family transporter [Actinobacteria bacterium]|nr:MAG: AI-2E family transporter [Actinomycetota bacterium]